MKKFKNIRARSVQDSYLAATLKIVESVTSAFKRTKSALSNLFDRLSNGRSKAIRESLLSERGDVPGWVLVVLMTTGLVTAIWTIAQPRLSAILRNSLDSMNNVR